MDLLNLWLKYTQLFSKKFLEEKISAGTNFHELEFDHDNRENFCLAKISRYTVPDLGYYKLFLTFFDADIVPFGIGSTPEL